MSVESLRSVLIGRDDELGRLGGLLRDVTDGSGRSAWVEGEPGIGKSALLDAALIEAERLGYQVFRAAADEFDRQCPLRLMLDCLGVEPTSADPLRREIAELFSGSGPAGGMATADPFAAPLERLLTLVDHLATEAPLVLSVDDLQWADEASVMVLYRMTRLVRRLPILIIGACRPVPRRADVKALRRGLAASGAEMITVPPLPAAAVTHLISELVAAPTVGANLRRAADQAGGNPRYLRDLVDALALEGRVQRQADTAELIAEGTDAVPRSLTAAISDRLSFLSQETAETLRAAALLGTTFSVTDLGVVVGRSALELTAALEEATATGVLAESAVHLTFRHTLIRQTLYERTPAGLRLALHRHAARALADAGMDVERVAEQLLLVALHQPDAIPSFDAWVVNWLLRMGGTLVRRAPEAAVELLGLAVEHLPGQDPRREPLEAVLAQALVLFGRREEAIRLAERVLRSTRRPARSAEMSWTIGWAMADAESYGVAEAVLVRALGSPGLDDVWSARLHAMLGRAALAGGDLDQAESAARRALEGADRTGDRNAAAEALNVLGTVLAHRGDLEGAGERFVRAVATAEFSDDPETQDLLLLLRQNQASLLLAQERHDDAAAAAGALLADAERTATPPRLAGARLLTAEIHYHAGRWDDAIAQLDAAAEARDLMTPADRRWSHGLAAVIAIHRDDQAAAEAHLSAVPAGDVGKALSGAEYVPLARALLAERRGRPEQALAILTGLLDQADMTPVCQRHVWLPPLLRLALTAGDSAVARAAAEACPGGAHPATAPGTGDHRTTVERRCSGLLESDHETLAAVVDDYRSTRRPLHLAQTLEDVAVVLAEADDLRAARAAHAEAVDLYTKLGAAWELLRADTRLRTHGVHRRRGQRRRATTGWEALTPAELTVARLVAEGLANPDIAAKLFLSRRTVEVHVSHILAKLGARSRVEIAREAASRLPAPWETGSLPVPAKAASPVRQVG
jgi:DNA-binding CsgD family transcriptional regulator